MTNTITRLQALITQAEAQTDKLPIVALRDEDIQALKDAVKMMEWQPIETAPRREPFIATGQTETPCVVTTTAPEFEKAGYPFCCYHTQVCFHKSKFTHWMPLPKPPKEAK